jgi:hypothetical protein
MNRGGGEEDAISDEESIDGEKGRRTTGRLDAIMIPTLVTVDNREAGSASIA